MSIAIRRPITDLPSPTLRLFREQAGEFSKGLIVLIKNDTTDQQTRQEATEMLEAVLTDLVLIDTTLKQRGLIDFAS